MGKNKQPLIIPKNTSSHCWSSDYLVEVNNAITRHSNDNPAAESFNHMAIKLPPKIRKIINDRSILSPEKYDEKRAHKQNLKKDILKNEQELAQKSRSVQSLLSQNQLTYDQDALCKQYESSKVLIEENKKMNIQPTAEELQRLNILKQALDEYKQINSLEKTISTKKSDYHSIKDGINMMRDKIISSISEIINVLNTYKSKSNNKSSNRSTEIQNLKNYMLNDLKSLKKQKNTDANDDKKIKE